MTLPQILQRKICSPSGEKSIYFPSGNPKNSVFRRAGHDPPLQLMPGVGFFDSLRREPLKGFPTVTSPRPTFTAFNPGSNRRYLCSNFKI